MFFFAVVVKSIGQLCEGDNTDFEAQRLRIMLTDAVENAEVAVIKRVAFRA